MTTGPVILVVDDEPGVRRLTCVLLERGGYRTREAEDGVQALALLSAEPGAVALVLTDVRMPEMNGIQLEQAVREAWPRLPVLLMSGEVTREWVVRLIREHPHRVIRKPFESAELLDKVRQLLAPGAEPGGEPRLG